MNCAFVILSWNSEALLRTCLTGLLAHESWPVYIVDNGSADESVEMIQREFPNVSLICAGGNLGFAGGSNIGIQRAIQDGAEAVFLLNNDTIIDEPFVAPCLVALEQNPSLGVIGPVIVEGMTPSIIQCAGGFQHSWSARFPLHRRGDVYLKSDKLEPVDWVLGAAMLVRSSVFQHLGTYLDAEYYPAYMEEADLCFRIRMAGFGCRITHKARVRHIGGSSSGGSRTAFGRCVVNRFRFAVKHLAIPTFVTASMCIALSVCRYKIRAS